MGAAALAEYVDAMTEYGIALFNGAGVAKNEAQAAFYLQKAAKRGAPIAMNRLAHILMTGRGLPIDPVAAATWHIVSKAAGTTDLVLDEYVSKQPKDVRDAAEKRARPWLMAIAASRS